MAMKDRTISTARGVKVSMVGVFSDSKKGGLRIGVKKPTPH
jgi:hypothetical protein